MARVITLLNYNIKIQRKFHSWISTIFHRQLDLRGHRGNGASCFTKIRL